MPPMEAPETPTPPPDSLIGTLRHQTPPSIHQQLEAPADADLQQLPQDLLSTALLGRMEYPG